LTWKTLTQAGATPAGTEAVEWLRIACGIPRFGRDIRERDLPQETEQARALHFSKGCYVGQEIVERIHSRGSVHRTFTGFTIEGELPAAGTKIQADGKDVGEITSSASLPAGTRDFPAALGYIRREAAVLGKQVTIGSTKGIVHPLPFREVFEG
jgi:aminomethyltransferase